MKIHRNYIKIAAIAIAISAALPALADETTVSVGKHHFVYYRDHDIYYAPESKTYYWIADGKWQSGPALRVEDQRYITSGGVDIDLDTDRPYERNDYVVKHYASASGPATRETTTTERSVGEDGTTTTTTTTTQHKYVYYGDHDIYFAPNTPGPTTGWPMASGSQAPYCRLRPTLRSQRRGRD